MMVLTQNDEYKGDVVEYFLKRKDEVSNTLKKLGFSGTVLNGKGLFMMDVLQKNIYLQLNLLLLKYCIKNMVWKHVPLF